MVPAELFPLSLSPLFHPPLRLPRSSPCCRRSSLPSTRTQSLRMGRASNPQGAAASSPRQHSRRRFCRHCPRTSSTLKSQIPTWTRSRPQQPSSAGFRPATPSEWPLRLPVSVGCKGLMAPACRACVSLGFTRGWRPWSASLHTSGRRNRHSGMVASFQVRRLRCSSFLVGQVCGMPNLQGWADQGPAGLTRGPPLACPAGARSASRVPVGTLPWRIPNRSFRIHGLRIL